ncbi:MAG: EAL domain-containing protein [Cellvibrionaceae bacterium]|nr:EAL domain-containing protein [Cellvibrionaceae bacterium]
MDHYHKQIAHLAQHHLGTTRSDSRDIQNFLSDINQLLLKTPLPNIADSASLAQQSVATMHGGSAAELRAMLEAIPETFFHINREDEIIAFKLSENFCDLGRRDPAPNEELFACFPPGLSPQLRTLFDQCRSSQQSCDSEISLTDILQKKHVYGIRVKPMKQQQLMVVLRDITQPYREDLSMTQSLEDLGRQSSAIAKIAASIDNRRPLGGIVELATQEICHALASTKAAVWFFAEPAQRLDCACLYQRHNHSFQQPASVPVSAEDFSAHFLPSGDTGVLAVNRIDQDPRTKLRKALGPIKTPDIVSFIDAPISLDDQLIGVLTIDVSQVPHHWTACEQQFAAAAAKLLALTYHGTHSGSQQQAPRQAQSRFEVIAERCSMAIFAYAESFVYANPAMEALSGFKFSQLEKFGVALLLSSDVTQYFPAMAPSQALVDMYAREGLKSLEKLSIPTQLEVEITPADSLARWLSISVVPVCLEGKNVWLACAVDISERRLVENKLRYKAYNDDLTGLPNRAMFTAKLEQSFEKRSRDKYYRFAVMLLELDKFNVVKKHLGQLSAEQLLLDAAQRLRQTCRHGDTLARLNGNEFTLLMENIANVEEVQAFAQKIQNLIVKPFYIDNNEVETSASIGIAYSNRRYEKVEDVLKDSETALMRAKSHGGGGCEVFNARNYSKTQKLMGVDRALEQAIESNKLQLRYQPLIALESGKLFGFEALLRWQVRGDEYLPPGELIPVAEESGHMLPLGNWIVKTACQRIQPWLDQDPDLQLCVNLSAQQLEQSDLTELIDNTMSQGAITPRNLLFDIQESARIKEGSKAFKNLHRLRTIGCEICLDDFGSGASSLSFLNSFPFKLVKIDKSLVNTFNHNKNSRNLLKTILYATQGLGIKVLAEGVENRQQLIELRALGCHYVQGFLFSKPVNEKLATSLIGRCWNPETGAIRRTSLGGLGDFFG